MTFCCKCNDELVNCSAGSCKVSKQLQTATTASAGLSVHVGVMGTTIWASTCWISTYISLQKSELA
jgi:hypothetical protein